MDKTIEIADDLVKFAQDVTGETDERAAVEALLRRALGKTSQPSSMSDLAGKIEISDGYDPEAEFCGARPSLTDEEKKKW